MDFALSDPLRHLFIMGSNSYSNRTEFHRSTPLTLSETVFVASIEYIDVRKGMVIVGDGGQLLQCLDRDLNTPGNWRAILQLKLKNLKTGSITINRVRPQDKVETAFLDKRDMQYLYAEGDGYVFMDMETFDQYTLAKDLMSDAIQYLKDNDSCKVTMYEGKALDVELPPTVELKVVETEPAMKGATAARNTSRPRVRQV